jgi:hypothetical protein
VRYLNHTLILLCLLVAGCKPAVTKGDSPLAPKEHREVTVDDRHEVKEPKVATDSAPYFNSKADITRIVLARIVYSRWSKATPVVLEAREVRGVTKCRNFAQRWKQTPLPTAPKTVTSFLVISVTTKMGTTIAVSHDLNGADRPSLYMEAKVIPLEKDLQVAFFRDAIKYAHRKG